MAIDYGRPPKRGFAKLVSELLVEDLCESLYFWREALGFEIAYQRPEQKFAYLERPEAEDLGERPLEQLTTAFSEFCVLNF